MIRKAGLFLAALTVLMLGFLQLTYGLGYIARVYIKQDANFDDFYWKPSVSIYAPTPRKLRPANFDIEGVEKAFEADANIIDLHDFLEKSGTTAFIVIKDGVQIYESHFRLHEPGEAVATFSVSKSAFSIVLGRAIEAGLIEDIDQPITHYLPELEARNSEFSNITLAHLIDMRSGIEYDKSTTFPFYNQDEPLVYYADDLRKNVLKYPEIMEPPGNFLYNNYNPNMLGLALERSSGKSLPDLLQEELWSQFGADYDAIWSTDYNGFPLLESGLVAAPIDLAWFGQAMLDSANPDTIDPFINQEWYERSTQFTSESNFDAYDGRQWAYKNGWWLILRPDGPPDYAAIGRFGQFIYVSPRNNVVLVRTGIDTIGLGDGDFTSAFYAASDRLSNRSGH
ncbi:MAG: beta-lactamase family protein [Hellea sp.]|nr:beta-lactamase family protein [Hellea sp.]